MLPKVNTRDFNFGSMPQFEIISGAPMDRGASLELVVKYLEELFGVDASDVDEDTATMFKSAFDMIDSNGDGDISLDG